MSIKIFRRINPFSLGFNSLLLALVAIFPYFLNIFMQTFFARSLSVEEIGVFALVNFFILFVLATSDWFVDRYIVASRDISEETINEAFTFELIFSLAIYLILFVFLKDFIDRLLGLDNPVLFWSLVIFVFFYKPLSRTKSLLEKKLLFFPAYLPALIGNFIGGVLGILFLLKGFGLWSMIIWKISTLFSEVIFLYFFSSQRLKINFQFKKLSSYISFCYPIFIGSLLSFFTVTADIWIVNALLSSKDLGYYWLAFSYSHFLLALRGLLNRVLLPALSELSSLEEKNKLFLEVNQYLQAFLIFGTTFAIFWAEPAFNLILGEKWSESILLFQILFFSASIKFISGIAGPLLHSVMNTRVDLSVSLFNLFFLLPMLVGLVFYYGTLGAAISVLISSIAVFLYIFKVHIEKLTGLGWFRYVSKYLLGSFGMLMSYYLLRESISELSLGLLGTVIGIILMFYSLYDKKINES